MLAVDTVDKLAGRLLCAEHEAVCMLFLRPAYMCSITFVPRH